MAKKIGGAVLRFFIRAAIGMALIFVINSYVIPADSSINVGLNAVSFLTSEPLVFLASGSFTGLSAVRFCEVFTKSADFIFAVDKVKPAVYNASYTTGNHL